MGKIIDERALVLARILGSAAQSDQATRENKKNDISAVSFLSKNLGLSEPQVERPVVLYSLS